MKTMIPGLLGLTLLMTEVALRADPPANDDFANAIVITGLSNQYQATLDQATVELDEPTGTSLSVWWRFVATSNGKMTISKDAVFDPRLSVYEGTSLAALTHVIDDVVDEDLEFYSCSVYFDVLSGATYQIQVHDDFAVDFELTTVFEAAPLNDDFAQRVTIPAGGGSVSGTTVGATAGQDEPASHRAHSIWWTWTPDQSGPVVLSTAGSECDTLLSVHTGATLAGLSLLATNDIASSVLPRSTEPTNDPSSRIVLDAVAGTDYQIAVSTSAKGAGSIMLNLSTVAIADFPPLQGTVQSNNAVTFSTNIIITNLSAAATGPLRMRLISRAGNSHEEGVFFACQPDWPALDAPAQVIDTINLPLPGTLASHDSEQIDVSGECPPPFQGDYNWGLGWGVIAQLEEQAGGEWVFRDARLLIVGEWPTVNGFEGPGGGVNVIASSIAGSGDNLGLQVLLGPPSAVAAGGGWRISSSSADIGNLAPYTNRLQTLPNTVLLGITSTNFMIEAEPVTGFASPSNATLELTPGTLPALNLQYSVIRPSLSLNPAGDLSLTGVIGLTYRIEQRDGFGTNHPWSPWMTNTINTNPKFIAVPIDAAIDERYFRAVQLP